MSLLVLHRGPAVRTAATPPNGGRWGDGKSICGCEIPLSFAELGGPITNAPGGLPFSPILDRWFFRLFLSAESQDFISVVMLHDVGLLSGREGAANLKYQMS